MAACVFDNDRPTAVHRLGHLSTILDAGTIGRLTRLGVGAGWRCLEVGAGNGSVAAWLADQAGPSGQVIATDIKPRLVRRHPGVTVLRHDVTGDDLPAGPFQLIHVRLLLAHLPRRCEVLFGMADRLAPGGALVVEEWGAAGPARILSAADPGAPALFDRYQQALLHLMRAHGHDPEWAVRVPAAMGEAGLVNVDTEMSARSWRGGTAGCMLPVAEARELRGPLIAAGIAGAEQDRLARVLSDPRTLIAGNITFSTVGRRPRVDEAVGGASGRPAGLGDVGDGAA